MVVTPRASQADAEEDGPGSIYDVDQQVAAQFLAAALNEHARAQEPETDLTFGAILGVGAGVAGELFPDETIIRPVLIKCPDHVVAVAPHVRHSVVETATAGVG